MTKINTVAGVFFVSAMSLMGSASTQAALIDRGNGLIYDNVLNITWIQDVALSSTLGGPGRFNWSGANNWADQLVYGGYDDWRLPTLAPVNGVKFNGFSTVMARLTTDMAFQPRAANLRASPATSLHTCTTSISEISPVAQERGHIWLARCLGPTSAYRTLVSWML